MADHHSWPAVAMAPGRERASGSGATAGHQGWLSREAKEKVEVHLHLAPGGEDKGLWVATPIMGKNFGLSVRPSLRCQAASARRRGAECSITGRRRCQKGSGRRPGGAPGVGLQEMGRTPGRGYMINTVPKLSWLLLDLQSDQAHYFRMDLGFGSQVRKSTAQVWFSG